MSIKGVVHPTVKGVPQGGVISPLLANAVLNKLDWFLHEKGVHGTNEERRNRDNRQINVRFSHFSHYYIRVGIPKMKNHLGHV